MIQPSRRRFLTGLASLLAAPAIVRASNLMAISPFEDWARNEITAHGSGLWLAQIYDLLIPGVRQLKSAYVCLPDQWAAVFDAKLTAPSSWEIKADLP